MRVNPMEIRSRSCSTAIPLFRPMARSTRSRKTHRLPYVQQWNFGIQRQIGNDWLVSVSYIGNEVTHLYGMRELNPAIFVPGNCSAGQYGLTAPGLCSTTANTNDRRLLTQLNPTEGTKYGFVDVWDDGGTRNYHGLLLDTQKRVSHG